MSASSWIRVTWDLSNSLLDDKVTNGAYAKNTECTCTHTDRQPGGQASIQVMRIKSLLTMAQVVDVGSANSSGLGSNEDAVGAR